MTATLAWFGFQVAVHLINIKLCAYGLPTIELHDHFALFSANQTPVYEISFSYNPVSTPTIPSNYSDVPTFRSYDHVTDPILEPVTVDKYKYAERFVWYT